MRGHSTNAAYKPHTPQQGQDEHVSTSYKDFPQWGRRWKKTAFSSQLSKEELEIRKTLRPTPTTQIPLPRSQNDRPSRSIPLNGRANDYPTSPSVRFRSPNGRPPPPLGPYPSFRSIPLTRRANDKTRETDNEQQIPRKPHQSVLPESRAQSRKSELKFDSSTVPSPPLKSVNSLQPTPLANHSNRQIDDEQQAPRDLTHNVLSEILTRSKRFEAFVDSPRAPHPAQTRGINRARDRQTRRFVSGYDDEMGEDDVAERRRQRKKERAVQKNAAPPTPVYLPDFITVSNLAAVLRVRAEDFGNKMRALGFEETNNDHILDAETAGLIATEFNFEPVVDTSESEDLLPQPPVEYMSELPTRPPIVTIMGHVDHGKTTLLDWLRKSSVAASEHGGITQHIGAFSVSMPSGRLITFLDTPGHAAFLTMRKRGANVTDIVILVVAADDSVMPQTIEAIKHAQAAKVPIIVAVNKVDKEDANVERVKHDLARYGVEIEDFGGDTQVVRVSGKTGTGMAELEEAVIALADILDMRAHIDGPAEGWVLEATTKNNGRMATVLVRRGTLRPGNVIVAGLTWARVRSLRNEAGVQVAAAGPGTPIEIDGWKEQPVAGDQVLQAPDEKKAKSVVEFRIEASRRTQMALDMIAVNDARRLEQEKRELGKMKKQEETEADSRDESSTADNSLEGAPPSSNQGMKEVFFIVKADVSGSVEAVLNSVSALGNSEVRPNILRSGVGPVTEFDIDHAAVAKGHIISFNTSIDASIARLAETAGVRILDQSIIYRLIEDVSAKLSEQLTPRITQRVLGEAEIAQVFEINTTGRTKVPVAGCKVRNGIINKNARVRVSRGKKVIFDGKFSSLKNVKKDVMEMRKGNECGMGFLDWIEFKVGDEVQCYEEDVERRTL